MREPKVKVAPFRLNPTQLNTYNELFTMFNFIIFSDNIAHQADGINTRLRTVSCVICIRNATR